MSDDECWHVYMLRTCNGALYTGITLDVTRRLSEHTGNTGKGAKYLRARTPLTLEYTARVGSRGTALQLEHRIKKLSKVQKEELIAEQPGIDELLRRFSIGR